MSTAWSVPLVDISAAHEHLGEVLIAIFRGALATGRFIGGSMVDEFEREFAQVCEVRSCIGVGSGTDALRLALTTAGVQPGDSVVTVPNTFIATTEAISQVGAQSEFVDIDAATYTMDPDKLEAYLNVHCRRCKRTGRLKSKRTGRPVTAVVPVHLYGQMANMDPIIELARAYGLIVIEDACQAHSAEYFSKTEGRWCRAGSMGEAAAFSFYPGKNLGACGEAGAITTNNEQLARRCRVLRDHGQSRKYVHEVEGYNSRLDAIQAGILGVKLRRLEAWTEQRRQCAAIYDRLFIAGSRVREALSNDGIETGIHYPIPLHLAKPYEALNYRIGDFPVAERMAAQILSLPMYPQLSIEQQELVVNRLLKHTTRASEVVSRSA